MRQRTRTQFADDRMKRISTFCLLLFLGACSSARTADLQCVPYARKLSGIPIYGDAHTWWDKATRRGQQPRPGAVLVLAKTTRLEFGHLAVVQDVLDERTIIVAHANWGSDWRGHGYIYDAMSAIDVSETNDWSAIRFWNPNVENYGMVYLAYGFVYE